MLTTEAKFQQLTCNHAVRDDLRAKSLRAAALTGTTGLADFAVRIGSTAVLARLLSPEHFGLIMMVTAVTMVADQVREMGLSTATVQAPQITHARATNLFWTSAGIGAGMALLICAASPLIAYFYSDPRLTAITCALATNFIFGGLMTQHQALLTRKLKLGQTSAVRLSSSFLSTAIAIGLAMADFDYWALVWREVIRSVLMTLGMWICFPWIPGLPHRSTSVRKQLRFGVDLTGANILSSFTAGADRFLLGKFWGATPVAIYRQAYQLLLVPMDQLLSPLHQVSQPSLSMLQSDPARYRIFFRKILLAVCLVTMPTSVYIAVYSQDITAFLLGARWLECAPILFALSFATFIRQPVCFSALLLITRGRSRTYLYLIVAQQFLVLAAIGLGVAWGPMGVAVGEVAATYLMIAPTLHFCVAGSPVSLRDVLGILGRVAAVSVAMAAGLLLYQDIAPSIALLPRLAAGGVLAAALFIAIWLIFPGGRAELLEIIRDLRTALGKRLPARDRTAISPASCADAALHGPSPIIPKT